MGGRGKQRREREREVSESTLLTSTSTSTLLIFSHRSPPNPTILFTTHLPTHTSNRLAQRAEFDASVALKNEEKKRKEDQCRQTKKKEEARRKVGELVERFGV
ncbi:hypothetical protein PM082_012506 [Marasmius tenuissimus]|nr:hypothetical protein PM082_012506 [Marasmius tenuissimus]